MTIYKGILHVYFRNLNSEVQKKMMVYLCLERVYIIVIFYLQYSVSLFGWDKKIMKQFRNVFIALKIRMCPIDSDLLLASTSKCFMIWVCCFFILLQLQSCSG